MSAVTLRKDGSCDAGPDLREGGSVTIVGPDGSALSRAELFSAEAQVTRNGKFYVPGTCNLEFVAVVPDMPGVFTVEVGSSSAQFEAGDERVVVRVG